MPRLCVPRAELPRCVLAKMSAALLVLVALWVAALGRDVPLPRRKVRNFPRVARLVAGWNPCSGASPWELSDLDDGDIILSPQPKLLHFNRIWENRSLPFVLERTFYKHDEWKKITNAIEKLNELSCLRFWESDDYAEDFIRIQGEHKGCYIEQYGRKGGTQVVNLQPPSCLEPGTIFHVLLHAAGFRHMHNVPDRDTYITVHLEHVDKERHKHFNKYDTSDHIPGIGKHYDYGSIMHFSNKAHSMDGNKTIVVNGGYGDLERKIRPSRDDIVKLNIMYNCHSVHNEARTHP